MTRRDQREPSWVLALSAIALATLTIYFSTQIRAPANVRDGDPGPTAFPIGLGVVLLTGGLLESARIVASRRKRTLQKRPEAVSPTAKEEKAEGRHALVAMAAVIGYAWLIPRLGFPLTSFLFATLAMTYLGMRWFWSAACALLLVVLIQVLFVVVFRVQLPSGRYLDFIRNFAVERAASLDPAAQRKMPDFVRRDSRKVSS